MNDVSGSVYLPVASLLTGINKPDHHQYFKNLCDNVSRRNGTHTIVLPARDCPNVKSAIELLVSCVLSKGRTNNYRDDDEVKLMHYQQFNNNNRLKSRCDSFRSLLNALFSEMTRMKIVKEKQAKKSITMNCRSNCDEVNTHWMCCSLGIRRDIQTMIRANRKFALSYQILRNLSQQLSLISF